MSAVACHASGACGKSGFAERLPVDTLQIAFYEARGLSPFPFAEMTASASLRQLELVTSGIAISSRQDVMVSVTGNTTDRGSVLESGTGMNAVFKFPLGFPVAQRAIHFGQVLGMREVGNAFQVGVTTDTGEARHSMN